MRASDAAAPTIPPHVPVPGQPSAAWKAQPIVGLEYLPDADLYDDIDTETVVYDSTLTWDDPATAAGYTDVWCDTTGLEIVHGEPDENELLPPSRATLTLYDPTGKYRRRTPDGRLVYYAPGRRLSCLARIAGVSWWLFNGRIATWHELADGFVEITAYSSTANLAQDPGTAIAPGAAAETLRARLTAILAHAAAAGPGAGITLRSDLGLATLAVPAADRQPWLEQMQQAAWSDGGLLFADADDTLIGRDRNWRDGRADQPAAKLALTDNVCDAGAVIVWQPETGHDDEWLAGRVLISNAAGLTATASNPAESIDPALLYTHPDDDLWRTQPEGDALAQWIAFVRGTARLAIARAVVHLHDPRFDYWQQIIDTRLADRVRWLHVERFAGQLDTTDVDVIVCTVRHLLTADTWTVELETTPAIAYTPVPEWDVTSYTWDDAAAVWL